MEVLSLVSWGQCKRGPYAKGGQGPLSFLFGWIGCLVSLKRKITKPLVRVKGLSCEPWAGESVFLSQNKVHRFIGGNSSVLCSFSSHFWLSVAVYFTGSLHVWLWAPLQYPRPSYGSPSCQMEILKPSSWPVKVFLCPSRTPPPSTVNMYAHLQLPYGRFCPHKHQQAHCGYLAGLTSVFLTAELDPKGFTSFCLQLGKHKNEMQLHMCTWESRDGNHLCIEKWSKEAVLFFFNFSPGISSTHAVSKHSCKYWSPCCKEPATS